MEKKAKQKSKYRSKTSCGSCDENEQGIQAMNYRNIRARATD